jgi:hypothetical protein
MKILITAIAVTLIAGCSSSPKVTAQKPQYCYTSQTITTKDGEQVNSRTEVECTDDQFKRLTSVRMGLANNCGISYRTLNVGGKLVEYEIPSCQVLDRSGNVIGWEYVKR